MRRSEPYIFKSDEYTTLWCGDVLDTLRRLPAESVHCVVTSPPFYGLRDYGTANWDGGDPECDHAPDKRGSRFATPVSSKQASNAGSGTASARDCPCGATRVDRQIGLEQSPDEYIARMVEVFREARRVLRRDGTAWVNLGDSYAGSGKGPSNGISNSRNNPAYQAGTTALGIACGRNPAQFANGQAPTTWLSIPAGIKSKDLLGIPWALAFALRADGWYLRSDIIWSKPNPMPESVTDRPTKAHEYIFLLSKSREYFYDAEVVREPAVLGYRTNPNSVPKGGRTAASTGMWRNTGDRKEAVERGQDQRGATYDASHGRNKRSVWEIATQAFPGCHFATYPEALVEPCIKAGTSERGCCPECGAPWEREMMNVDTRHWTERRRTAPSSRVWADGSGGRHAGTQFESALRAQCGWRPTCAHYDDLYRAAHPESRNARTRWQRQAWGDWWRRTRRRPGLPTWPAEPAVVLDPFGGSGTTARVAKRLGRRGILIELNPKYCELAVERVGIGMDRMPLMLTDEQGTGWIQPAFDFAVNGASG